MHVHAGSRSMNGEANGNICLLVCVRNFDPFVSIELARLFAMFPSVRPIFRDMIFHTSRSYTNSFSSLNATVLQTIHTSAYSFSLCSVVTNQTGQTFCSLIIFHCVQT